VVTKSRVLRCGERDFVLGSRTFVMGIVNVTPDSFSDGGTFASTSEATAHAEKLLADGADLVDIGGESTKPGAALVPPDVERARVLPVVAALARNNIRAICVDTRNAVTARACLAEGASWINDVTALTHDVQMAPTCASADAIVLMHWPSEVRARWAEGTTKSSGDDVDYASQGGVEAAVHAHLAERVDAAVSAGVLRERIVVDPGLGFGKNVDDNLRLLKAGARFASLGAVLMGPSRKRFVGALAHVDHAKDRDAATLGAVSCAIFHGADFVRVHDVKGAVECARVVDAVVRGR
jgi:dihydropteroate synthase